MRTPDEILTDYDDGCKGLADIDMRAVLHEVIDDICNSYKLAIEATFQILGVDSMWADTIAATVQDYIVNNYGDD